MSDRGAVTVERLEAAGPIAQEWEDLASRVGVWPDLRPGWIEAWWRAFGEGRLEILAARSGGELVGVLPLVRRGRRVESPTNWETSLFGLVAAGPDAAAALADAVFAGRPRVVSLRFVDPAELEPFRRAARGRGYRVTERLMQRAPYLELTGEWEGIVSHLGRSLRANLRRRRRRLEEQGDLTLQVADGTENLQALLEEGWLVEGTDWKLKEGTAIRSSPETLGFYGEVSRWAAEQGILRLAFLRLDGRPIAFDLCFEDGGVHWLVKTGFDAEHRNLSPGNILRHDMIKRAFDLGLTRYEFLGGEEAYKADWTDRAHDRLHVQAFAPTPLGLARRLAERVRPAAGRILGPVLRRFRR